MFSFRSLLQIISITVIFVESSELSNNCRLICSVLLHFSHLNGLVMLHQKFQAGLKMGCDSNNKVLKLDPVHALKNKIENNFFFGGEANTEMGRGYGNDMTSSKTLCQLSVLIPYEVDMGHRGREAKTSFGSTLFWTEQCISARRSVYVYELHQRHITCLLQLHFHRAYQEPEEP